MNHSHKDHRDRLRLEKLQLKDHLYRAAQVPILEAEAEDFWARLLTLNERHGKFGPYQLWHEHMPKWDKFQLHHGTPCPGYLRPDHAPRVTELHQKVKAALDRAAVSPHTLTTEAVLQAVHMQAGTV
jgi:hypothetical protein